MSGETDKGQQLPVALRWSGSSGMAGMLACVAVAGAVAVWARWPVWAVLTAGLSAQAAVMTLPVASAASEERGEVTIAVRRRPGRQREAQ